ncbi:MAG: B12-binding domain-containing radical SAM protein [Candidatus Jettenia sp.]|uniref:Oxidoreductase n=1 Tax=Candidatus Jettenia caeni TaxID=247490 RepID=I3IGG8_9BACT|nr:radical SAM protein [Candidatus Jettenia sp. AMX1]MBC6929774.1 B12-binding domain-containing radical SAM protein [Candidatus Jettenia sp.]NUN22713.1 B12-binding domain-containing radical SAM protein [Candidatus Jettenia caeni]KAA0248798.1 MAG: B12-binding domain-containing radical SAM protein [Candidatus Jettenia sp. AMX1]MCE7881410.1 B12-binding domain-containing radical SAM protein [Candidatus Jettenia sp. AMX1]MCQ3927991.1 B12-binding domain-containing radical SAM protein [Candidatus Jet
MIDILLIYPPYLSKHKSPPLGLAYLAAFVEQQGYKVKILDMNPLGLTLSDIEDSIKKNKPEIIGISFMTNQFGNALKVAQTCKSIYPKIPIILGGNHVSALPEEAMEYDFVDFVILREGEITFRQLVEALDKGIENWEKIDGLVFKRDGNIIKNRDRALIEDLDILPFPKWDDFPINAYSEKILGVSEELPVFSVFTSRGCPGKCAFCSSHTAFTRRFRKRSAENIFSELQFLEEKFGARYFNFIDDTLTIDKKRVDELCDLIINTNKQYRWIANARVNTVDKEVLKKMYMAGCRNICFGVESGDPEVRKNVGKGIAGEQIKNAHIWAKDAGLIVSSFFMVGNLGETWESIEKTIALARELHSDYPTCAIATPFPDTRFMEEAEKNGWLITKDWNRYITNPHIDQDYFPVSTNGILSAEELLEAYYKVNAAFAKIKLTTKYGERYLFNPEFYTKEIGSRIKKLGISDSLQLGWKLLKGGFN